MKNKYFHFSALAGLLACAAITIIGCSKDSNPASNGSSSSSISIKTPSVGTIITEGTQNYQITWVTTGVDTTKTLEYSLDNGGTWATINTVNPKVNGYSWSVPNKTSTTALIRITDKNGIVGTSGAFTIAPIGTVKSTITITAPATGAILTAGTPNYPITWTTTGVDTVKNLEYSLNGGSSWNAITQVAGKTNIYNWDIPNSPSTSALIRITDKNGVQALSGTFTIAAPSGLAVGEMDATISGASFKVMNAKKTSLSQLAFSVKGSITKFNNASFDSVSLTLVIPIQGGVPYSADAATDDNTQITYCITNPISGTCATSYTAKKGTGSGTIKITSLTPIVEGTFTGTLMSGTNSITITNGAFKAQFN